MGELSGRAPAKLEQRLVHLPAEAAAAAAGDLITQDGRTWLLGGPPDPDPSALSKNWIATELTVAASYDAAGRPLLAWDGVNWVPAA